MRLITTNYSQLPATTVTASSQNLNFLSSNIKHEFRSKEWRSNATGNFVIDTTNNKIDFSEGGPELTATITSGTYNSTTLSAEIKSQLDASGALTYTVSKSETTGKWTISATGTFELLINTGSNENKNTLKLALGFSDSDLDSALTYTGSNIAIHTEEWITLDLKTTEEINSLALLWPKEAGITLSDNAVVTVQANATNTWTSPAVSEVLTLDDTYEIASYYFTTDKSYRYWRVKIVDPGNAYLYVNLGVIVLGKSEQIENPDNGFLFRLVDRSEIQQTPYGHEYVDEYPKVAQLEIEFKLLDYDDAKLIDSAFRSNGTRKPVFITIDAVDAVHDKDHLAIYGKFRESFELTHINYDLFQTSLVIGEIS